MPAWEKPRRHLLTKGVGVTALSMLAADIVGAVSTNGRFPGTDNFERYLRSLSEVDWSTRGDFRGFGGRQGAREVHEFLAARVFSLGVAKTKVRR